MSDFREGVAKILVKWNMSTRQSAITEIVALHEKAVEEAKKEERKRITEWFKSEKEHLAHHDFLLTIDDNGLLVAESKALSEPEKQENNPGWNDNANQW